MWPITFFCESSIRSKCDSKIIILKWSPPSWEIGRKSESLWWVGKLGKGKWNTWKFHVAGFPVNRDIYNIKTFLHSKIYKLLTNFAPLAYMPSPIHAVLVIITGWHDQPHFTLLPPMHHNRPPSLPLPTTILQGTDLVVLGMQWIWFAENQRKDRPRG